jgi:hypothetical protein
MNARRLFPITAISLSAACGNTNFYSRQRNVDEWYDENRVALATAVTSGEASPDTVAGQVSARRLEANWCAGRAGDHSANANTEYRVNLAFQIIGYSLVGIGGITLAVPTLSSAGSSGATSMMTSPSATNQHLLVGGFLSAGFGALFLGVNSAFSNTSRANRFRSAAARMDGEASRMMTFNGVAFAEAAQRCRDEDREVAQSYAQTPSGSSGIDSVALQLRALMPVIAQLRDIAAGNPDAGTPPADNSTNGLPRAAAAGATTVVPAVRAAAIPPASQRVNASAGGSADSSPRAPNG